MEDYSNMGNIKKTWQVAWGISTRDFTDYTEALSFFNDLLYKKKNTVLYEIISDLDSSKIKKIPILNSKIKDVKTRSATKKSSKINIEFSLKYRILILILVFFSFFLILYILSNVGGGSKNSTTMHTDFVLSFLLNFHLDIYLNY